jgi:hypothetical protein
MTHSTRKELNKGVGQKRLLAMVMLISLSITLVLAVTSYTSTQVMWDGMFPSGEYHLFIQDKAGNPIQGAVLNVFEGASARHAFKYPFDDYLSENSFISNSSGEIIITHYPRGLEFGGISWRLFWLIPIGIGGPKFTCQITAEGYKVDRFSSDEIFDMAYATYKDDSAPRKLIYSNGNEYTIMVLGKTMVLEKR